MNKHKIAWIALAVGIVVVADVDMACRRISASYTH